jgi:hypothetical protein
MTLKVQMEFRMNGDGWSEHLYHGGDGPKAFAVLGQALCNERKKSLVNVATIHHCRISKVGGGARSYRFPVASGSGMITLTRDVGPVTRTMGLYGDSGAYRLYKFHGRPDDTTQYDINGNLSTGVPALLDDFVQYLITNSYQIRHITQAANDDTLVNVASVAVAGPTVTFVLAGSIPDGTKKVVISGMKGYGVRQFNAVWTVANLTTVAGVSTFTTSTTRPLDTRFNYVANTGKIRVGGSGAFGFQNIADRDAFCGAGTRKTGRPTDEPRGRRSLRR